MSGRWRDSWFGTYWSCIVFAVGTEVTAIAVYMRYWFAGVPGWVWIVGFSSILIGVNALNVKVFGSPNEMSIAPDS